MRKLTGKELQNKKNCKNERDALYHYWEVYDRSVNREEKSGILDEYQEFR